MRVWVRVREILFPYTFNFNTFHIGIRTSFSSNTYYFDIFTFRHKPRPGVEDPIVNDDVSGLLDEPVFYYRMSSHPISLMYSYVFHAENTRVLVYFSFGRIIHTTEGASVAYERIILFLRNNQKIGNKTRAVVSTGSVYFSHLNATALS